MASKSNKDTTQKPVFSCTASDSNGNHEESHQGRIIRNIVVFGDNIPGWKRLVAEGHNATTTMVGTKTTTSVHPGSLKLVLRSVFADPSEPDVVSESQGIHIPGSGASSPPLSLSEADNLAMIDFLRNCKDAQTQMQGGTFLAELKETIDLIRAPMRLLHNRTASFIKEQRLVARGVRLTPLKLRAKAIARAVSEGWLAYSFGISPTIHDINDGFEALSELTHPSRPYTFPVRGKGSARASEDGGVLSSGFAIWGTNGIGRSLVKHSRFVRYYGKIHLPMTQVTVLDRFGLNLRDIVPTIWEEIPWSFLADYFSNIGDVLEAWSFDQALIEWVSKGSLTKSLSILTDLRQMKEVTPGPSFTKLEYSGFPGYVDWTTTSVVREVVNGGLHPSFSVELPDRGRLRKLANAVSLLFVSGGSRNPYARLG